MAQFYADENFDYRVVIELRQFGHDVLTVQEAGEAGQPDERVLEFATALGGAVLTFDRPDFRRLHRAHPDHCGSVSCTRDDDYHALAKRTHDIVVAAGDLVRQHLRVNRPP